MANKTQGCRSYCRQCLISMSHSWRKVLSENRKDILQAADEHNVFLGRLLDRMISTQCIQREQKELIMNGTTARDRLSKLLDIVDTEGRTAFDELCNGLEEFGTEHQTRLAEHPQQSVAGTEERFKQKSMHSKFLASLASNSSRQPLSNFPPSTKQQ